MAEEPEEPSLSERMETEYARQRVRAKDHIVTYSNFAQVGSTAWDIRLEFSLLGEFEPGKVGVTDLATIIMTPALAKALVNVLNGNVKAFEQENGEIKMPESIIREAQKRGAEAKARAESGAIPEASPTDDAKAKAKDNPEKVEPKAAQPKK